jgi:hypothetical protein
MAGMGAGVAIGCTVGVTLGLAVAVGGAAVADGAGVTVRVGVCVAGWVGAGVAVGLGVFVGTGVFVGVRVAVGFAVFVGVGVPPPVVEIWIGTWACANKVMPKNAVAHTSNNASAATIPATASGTARCGDGVDAMLITFRGGMLGRASRMQD